MGKLNQVWFVGVSRRPEFRISVLAGGVWLLWLQAYQPWRYYLPRYKPSHSIEEVGFFFWRIGFNLGESGPIAVALGLASIALLVYVSGWVVRGFRDLSIKGSVASPSSSPRPRTGSTPMASKPDRGVSNFPSTTFVVLFISAVLIGVVIPLALRGPSTARISSDTLPANASDRSEGMGAGSEISISSTPKPIDWDAVAQKYGATDVPSAEVQVVSERPLVSLSTGTWILTPRTTTGRGLLRIQNGTDLDSAVKLVTATYPRRILWTLYIRAGEEELVSGIDAGTYLLRFALGHNWEARTRKFLLSPSFYQAGRQLDFTEREPTADETGEYSKLDVTLHEFRGGNLPRKVITETLFNEGDPESATAPF